MFNRHILALIAALVACWLASPAARQESQFAVGRDLAKESAAAHKLAEERTPIPRMANGKPNLSGSWRLSGGGATYSWEEHLGGFGIASEGPTLIIDPADGKLPYQPWALEERERRRRPESAYEENVAKCILPGMPRMMVYNFFIAQSASTIVRRCPTTYVCGWATLAGDGTVTRSSSRRRT
jgi:hypothetical protein